MIRKATQGDVAAVAAIYDAIHACEADGTLTTGWIKGVYPTAKTAQDALLLSHLYVLEEGGRVLAAARINKLQEPEYAKVCWQFAATDDEVLVLHTLVVHPCAARKGLGKRFMAYYEQLARELGCKCLRIDTNLRNAGARRLYAQLGYREAGVVPCAFNGIPGVQLVCLEKQIAR